MMIMPMLLAVDFNNDTDDYSENYDDHSKNGYGNEDMKSGRLFCRY